MAGRARKAADPDGAAGSVWDEPITPERARAFFGAVVELLHASDVMATGVDRELELERQVAELDERNHELVAQLKAEDAGPQASAVTAERVVELERRLAEAQRELAEVRAAASLEEAEYENLAARAYVPREVPWTDVAAGMMTIARDGTPWMVEGRVDERVILANGGQTFPKTPADGETVRVLVPYVTPEQAEDLVRDELGGVEA